MGYSEVMLADSVFIPSMDGAPEKKVGTSGSAHSGANGSGDSGSASASPLVATGPPRHVSLKRHGGGDAPSQRKIMWGDDDFDDDFNDKRPSGGSGGDVRGSGRNVQCSNHIDEMSSPLSVQVDSSTPRMVSNSSWSDFSSMSLESAVGAARTPEGSSCRRQKTDSPTGMLSRYHSSSLMATASVSIEGEMEVEAEAEAAGTDVVGEALEPSIRSVSSIVCARKCKNLIHMVEQGFKAGKRPIPLQSGTGGAYCFLDGNEKTVCVIKPADEEPLAPNNPKGYVGRQLGEPGFKPSVRVGEAGLREVAAFLLDHGGFAGVPRTALVRVQHEVLHRAAGSTALSAGEHAAEDGSKLASMQAFVSHVGDVGDQGASRFPTEAVHRIGVLDIRLFNTDRHSGNILLRKSSKRGSFARAQMSLQAGLDRLGGTGKTGIESTDACADEGIPVGAAGGMDRIINRTTTTSRLSPFFGGRRDGAGGATAASAFGQRHSVDLVPIDHGFCLPENLEPPYLEWLHWPQASAPFSQETLRYIASLDPREDVELLREELPLLRPECLRLVELTTTLLKKGAAAGMNLAELGTILSRPVVGMQEDASKFEKICVSAKDEAFAAMREIMSGAPSPSVRCSDSDDDHDQDEELDEHLQFSLDDGAGAEVAQADEMEDADNLWGRMEGIAAMDKLSVSPMIPHSQLAESVASCAEYSKGGGSSCVSPESLSPEKIMRRQSSRLHQFSRPMFIPRSDSGKEVRDAGFHQSSMQPQRMMMPRRDRASSSVVERAPLFTSVSMDLSSNVAAEGSQPVPASTNGILSNLDGDVWDFFLAAFEREVEKLITNEWRQMQESMAHLFKPGTSCPV